MPEERVDSQFERSIFEFQQYLSDLIPPLVIADSMELLLQAPPKLLAAAINSWVSAQARVTRGARVSDYFFHAVKKIHMMGEYQLVPQTELLDFLQRLKPLVLSYCPPADRESLRHNLEHMGDLTGSVTSPVEVLYKQGGSQTDGGIPIGQQSVESATEVGVQRLGLLIQRIEKELASLSGSSETTAVEKQQQVVSEALAQAALSARMSVELETTLDQFRRLGISAGTEDVFRALGKHLPEWTFPLLEDADYPEDSHLKAMHRIVREAENPREGANRFHQMVKTALERFNEGHLPQAVSMLDLAEKIITAKEVEEAVSQNVRKRGHDNVDEEKLRKYAEGPENHRQLRQFMNFFEALGPYGLFETLRREPKRDRRRLLLLLLEVHGESSRAVALEQLRPPLAPNAPDAEVYFRRNLLYILRRIPPAPSENQDLLMETVSRHAALGTPDLILKEAIAYLGQMKDIRAEKILESLLQDVESVLLTSRDSSIEVKDLHLTLDRIAAALARIGFPEARRVLIEHAVKKKAKLGDTFNRLSELSSQDLSTDAATVEWLLAALKASMPSKLLGRFFQQRERELKIIVEALSSTPLPQVRRVLQEVANQLPDRPAGQAAAKILTKVEPVAQTKKTTDTSAPSLTGDLELFGLPALMQTLSDNSITGTLTLKDPNGSVWATIILMKGRFRSCQIGSLRGESAFFQLFEQPKPGSFQFAKSGDSGEPATGEELLPLMLEGIRRYDELQQARAVLPDQVKLTAKSTQPSPLAEEKDGLFFRELWNAVCSGATPQECEAMMKADAYRIRRLLVHWLEAGSITAAS